MSGIIFFESDSNRPNPQDNLFYIRSMKDYVLELEDKLEKQIELTKALMEHLEITVESKEFIFRSTKQ